MTPRGAPCTSGQPWQGRRNKNGLGEVPSGETHRFARMQRGSAYAVYPSSPLIRCDLMFDLPWFPRPQKQHTPRIRSRAEMDALTASAATSLARLYDLKPPSASAAQPVARAAALPAATGPVTASRHTTSNGAAGEIDNAIIAVGVHQRIVLPLPARAHLLVCDGSVDVEYRPAALNWIPERLQDPGPVTLSDGEHYECAEPGCVVIYGTGQHVAHVLIAQETGPCRAALQWVQRVFRHRRGQYPWRNTSGSSPRPRV